MNYMKCAEWMEPGKKLLQILFLWMQYLLSTKELLIALMMTVYICIAFIL